MAFIETLSMIIFWGMALWGLISLPLVALSYMWLKGLLTVPLRVKLRGGKMELHTRGINITPVYIPPAQTDFEIKDANNKKRKFNIIDDSIKLLAGVPTTLGCDSLPFTFSADKVVQMSQDMANSHIKNLNTFSMPLTDEKGQIIYNEIPVYNEETGEQLKDAIGNPVVRKIPVMRYLPIDPNLPGYEVPEFLSSKNLADQIESESMLAAKVSSGKDMKMLYIGGAVALALVGLAAVALVLLYAPKEGATAATSVVTTVSTTLANMPTQTTIPLSPPPMI